VTALAAVELYGRGLEGAEEELHLRDDRGVVRPLALGRWLGPVTRADHEVLGRAIEPVLDVGCGPGRHVLALARRGCLAVGIDISPVAVRVARERGAMVVEGCVFARVPGAGTWGSALLLDGNIGIGGRPATLLRRVASLLAPGGHVLVELEAPGSGGAGSRARIEGKRHASAWFGWSSVDAGAIAHVASDAGLCVTESWETQGRWFAQVTSSGSRGFA
jgi:SAM-dependent methyltransferase